MLFLRHDIIMTFKLCNIVKLLAVKRIILVFLIAISDCFVSKNARKERMPICTLSDFTSLLFVFVINGIYVANSSRRILHCTPLEMVLFLYLLIAVEPHIIVVNTLLSYCIIGDQLIRRNTNLAPQCLTGSSCEDRGMRWFVCLTASIFSQR